MDLLNNEKYNMCSIGIPLNNLKQLNLLNAIKL